MLGFQLPPCLALLDRRRGLGVHRVDRRHVLVVLLEETLCKTQKGRGRARVSNLNNNATRRDATGERRNVGHVGEAPDPAPRGRA